MELLNDRFRKTTLQVATQQPVTWEGLCYPWQEGLTPALLSRWTR